MHVHLNRFAIEVCELNIDYKYPPVICCSWCDGGIEGQYNRNPEVQKMDNG